VGVRPLAHQLRLGCQTSQEASIFAQDGAILEARDAPESQTLTVLSYDPDAILVPSGENATDVISRPWAFVFSLSSSSLPVRQAIKRQFWTRRVEFELTAHLNPRL